VQTELDSLWLERLAAVGRHRLIVTVMWGPDAARVHRDYARQRSSD